jgi:Tol biopolymer transport system component
MRLFAPMLVCVFSLLAVIVVAAFHAVHAPMLTYITRYHDLQFPTEITTVYLLDRLTGRNQALFEAVENVYDQAWSPDGRFLALSVARRRASRASTAIRVLDVYGNEAAAVYSDLGDAVNPNWLPDSTHLLFAFYDGLDTTIHTVDIHTPTEWEVVLDLPEFFISNLRLSPDGQRMIIAGGRDSIALYLVELDNPQLNMLTDYSVDYSWSPDGWRIVFSRNDETTRNGDLFIMNLEHYIQQRLTENISREFQPSWSPDGSQIAFVSDHDGDYEIYIMNADGTNVRQVTFNDVNDSQPVWMP